MVDEATRRTCWAAAIVGAIASACGGSASHEKTLGTPDAATVDGAQDTAAAPTACGLFAHVEAPEDFAAVCNPDDIDLVALEAQAVALVNADRAAHPDESNGAEPVAISCAVADVARLHSYTMCKRQQLAHTFDGEDLGGRLARWLGWQAGADYFMWGENIAQSWSIEAAEHDFVDNEPPCDPVAGGHRLNILNRDFDHVGIGICLCALQSSAANLWLTQDFVTLDRDHVTGTNPYCKL